MSFLKQLLQDIDTVKDVLDDLGPKGKQLFGEHKYLESADKAREGLGKISDTLKKGLDWWERNSKNSSKENRSNSPDGSSIDTDGETVSRASGTSELFKNGKK